MACKYLTEKQIEAIKSWGWAMKANYPEICVASYMVFNDSNGFIALDAFSTTPHRLGQGAFLVGTEVVSAVESSGEANLIHVGFVWLTPDPTEEAKNHIKRQILNMEILD